MCQEAKSTKLFLTDELLTCATRNKDCWSAKRNALFATVMGSRIFVRNKHILEAKDMVPWSLELEIIIFILSFTILAWAGCKKSKRVCRLSLLITASPDLITLSSLHLYVTKGSISLFGFSDSEKLETVL